MNLKIRKAVKNDCPALMELVHELALYEKAPQEVTVTMDEFEMAGFGPQAVWQAFVAELNEEIIGFAIYYTRYSTWKGPRLYLEDFIVKEAHRGLGVGRVLFETVIREANDKGYNGMSWQVLDWNEPAINFYNKYNAQLEAGWLNGSLSKEQVTTIAGEHTIL